MKEDLIELLKNKIWDQYQEITGWGFSRCGIEGLSPIQRVMWESKIR